MLLPKTLENKKGRKNLAKKEISLTITTNTKIAMDS
jgi:hypothetical protein